MALCAFDEGEEGRGHLSTSGASGEQPVFAADHQGTDRTLDSVVVDLNAPVVQVYGKRSVNRVWV